jgi:hypothetical protein
LLPLLVGCVVALLCKSSGRNKFCCTFWKVESFEVEPFEVSEEEVGWVVGFVVKEGDDVYAVVGSLEEGEFAEEAKFGELADFEDGWEERESVRCEGEGGGTGRGGRGNDTSWWKYNTSSSSCVLGLSLRVGLAELPFEEESPSCVSLDLVSNFLSPFTSSLKVSRFDTSLFLDLSPSTLLSSLASLRRISSLAGLLGGADSGRLREEGGGDGEGGIGSRVEGLGRVGMPPAAGGRSGRGVALVKETLRGGREPLGGRDLLASPPMIDLLSVCENWVVGPFHLGKSY